MCACMLLFMLVCVYAGIYICTHLGVGDLLSNSLSFCVCFCRLFSANINKYTNRRRGNTDIGSALPKGLLICLVSQHKMKAAN